MRILRGLESFPPELAPCAVALGTFDGIHLAHARILAMTVERAQALALPAVAITYDPHPATVLRPERAPAPIASPEENLARIAAHGLDAALVIPFTPEFSRIEAEAFVDEVLVGRLHAREVVVGFNHTFGRGARGTATSLRDIGARLGFVTHVLPPLQVEGLTVSSSVIREALREGDVALASTMLGRAYAVTGVVQRGAGRGRTLGFPTANLRASHPLLLASGVYVARASWEGGSSPAVVNVGYRPTFGEREYWVEAFLLDFAGDLYGRALTIAFLHRIRPETAFGSVEELRHQIRTDVETARVVLRGQGAA